MPHTHFRSGQPHHDKRDTDNEPVLGIDSGDTVLPGATPEASRDLLSCEGEAQQ